MDIIKRFIQKYPFVIVTGACIFVTLTCSIFLYGNLQNQVDDINQERQDRLTSFARIVAENCSENNSQDNVLASLLQISLETSSTPTTQATPAQIVVFTSALKDLEKPSPCRALVKDLLVAQGVSQEQINEIIHRVEVSNKLKQGKNATNSGQ